MAGMGGRLVPPLGSLGNAWNNASTGTNTNSNAVNVYDCPFCTAMGTVSGAATITVFYSFDGVNFYASANKIVMAGAGTFALDFTTGAPWIALQSSAGVTATATICAKD